MSRRIALITLGALVLVVGVWYGALWRPAEKHLATLRAAQVVAANNVLSLQAQADALRVQQKQLPKERAALAALEAAIPADPGLDQLIKVIDNVTNQAGVSLTSIGTPAPSGWGSSGSASAAPGPGPQSIAVGIGVQGSDVSLLRFVTDLNSASRLFVVDGFSLSSAPRAGAASAAASAASSYSLSVTVFYVSAASNNPVFPGHAVSG
jgi:Tfp pilus assembly protein PilO